MDDNELRIAQFVFTVFQSLITWGLVIFGWLLVRYDNNKREDKKDLRARVDSLIADIKASEVNAFNYFRVDESHDTAPILAREIKALRLKMSESLTSLESMSDFFKGSELIVPLMRFGQAITKGDFENNERRAIGTNDPKFIDISFHASILVNKLEEKFILQIKEDQRFRMKKIFRGI